jgi:hypothetical protein
VRFTAASLRLLLAGITVITGLTAITSALTP